MSAIELVAECESMDIWISVDSGTLVIDAPAESLTPSIKERIRANKSEIISHLTQNSIGWTRDQINDFYWSVMSNEDRAYALSPPMRRFLRMGCHEIPNAPTTKPPSGKRGPQGVQRIF